MGRFIVKLTAETQQDYYLEWSTITDSPVMAGLLLADFRDYYHVEYGRACMPDLDQRLARVAQHGTSSRDPTVDALSLTRGNRAGPNESCLTLGEIITAYCLQEPVRGGWTPWGSE